MAGIPTKYNGTQFRSRLEARYACVWDILGIHWEYECIELHSYIPDFILDIPFFAGEKSYSPVLVEVKPVFNPEEFRSPIDTIAHSGWTGAAIVAGAMLRKRELFVDVEEYVIGYGHPIVDSKHGDRNSADWFRVGWSSTEKGFMIGGPSDISAAWKEAGNRVQWLPKR